MANTKTNKTEETPEESKSDSEEEVKDTSEKTEEHKDKTSGDEKESQKTSDEETTSEDAKKTEDTPPELTKDDIRWFNPEILNGVDAVADLASLSNDPSGELDPSKTLDINYLGRVRVAYLSKEYGVKRYILASSCSVYGFREDSVLDENSPKLVTFSI